MQNSFRTVHSDLLEGEHRLGAPKVVHLHAVQHLQMWTLRNDHVCIKGQERNCIAIQRELPQPRQTGERGNVLEIINKIIRDGERFQMWELLHSDERSKCIVAQEKSFDRLGEDCGQRSDGVDLSAHTADLLLLKAHRISANRLQQVHIHANQISGPRSKPTEQMTLFLTSKTFLNI